MKKRMSAAEYLALRAAHPVRKPKRQQETVDQKEYIRRLNDAGMGFFYRIRSAGTYDPVRKTFRRNSELVGIPDIVGFTSQDRNGVCVPVYIEVKRVQKIEQRKKLIFKVKTTLEQNEFLLRAYRAGCRSGVAFNYHDCVCIAAADPTRYPRHPRTLCFLPKDELEKYAEHYAELKRIHAENASDPLVRNILWAL